MLKERLNQALSAFSTNVDSVTQLMRFDSFVVDLVVHNIEALHERLSAIHGAENSRLNAANTLAALRNIRSNDSLERYYREMLNQCNVLLVSYFASAAADIFRAGVTDAVKNGTRPRLLKEEIRIDLRSIPDIESDLSERAGDLLLATNRDINLQNMQSIASTFRDFFGYERSQDEVVNDIISSHACRHVIVHCGAVADRRMLGQLRSAHPRTLKVNVGLGERIQFSEQEIVHVSKQMTAYLENVATAIGEG